MNKERHAYTVMVLPEREGKEAFSFRISRRRFVFIVVCTVLAFFTMCVLIYKSVEAARKLSYFYTLSRENEQLKKENSRLHLIHTKIGRMDTVSSYLERLANVHGAWGKFFKKEDSSVAEFYSKGKEHSTERASEYQTLSFEKHEGKKTSDNMLTSLPVEGWITQPFCREEKKGDIQHLGIDIAAAEGKEIKAPAAGVVTNITYDQYYGKLLVIKHDKHFTTLYGHCKMILVAQNEFVKKGQKIALVGNTGRSTAPHLHYEVLKNGKNINPMEMLSSGKK